MDIRPGSRPQVARTKESTRSINCAPFEKVRGRDTTKSVQYRIIAQLARVISRTRRHRHYTAILRPRASHRRSAIEVFAEVPGVHRRQPCRRLLEVSWRTTAPRKALPSSQRPALAHAVATSPRTCRVPYHTQNRAHSAAQPSRGGAILRHMKVEEIAEAIVKLPPDQLARSRPAAPTTPRS